MPAKSRVEKKVAKSFCPLHSAAITRAEKFLRRILIGRQVNPLSGSGRLTRRIQNFHRDQVHFER